MSLRERLLLTRAVWLQLRANAAAALHILRTEPPGVSPSLVLPGTDLLVEDKEKDWTELPGSVPAQVFLVRKSNTRQCQALCVRLPEASGPSFVSSHYIQEHPGGERSCRGRLGAGREGGIP